jgi:tripartite-type tricarboxylate transporter receptor subunit TctC
VNDLVAAAKASPGKIVYGTSGIGTSVHLSTERFRAVAGIVLTHVPFKGVAPAMTDLLAGRVDVMILSLGFAGQFISSGKVRALALADEKRYDAFPDIPTFRERGIDFTSYAWYGLLAPRGTPAAVVARLAHEVGQSLADPKLRKRIAATAAEPMPMTPQKFDAFLKDDVARWQAVIKANGVKFD